MAPKSSRSSKTSLVSIDPAVASHIADSKATKATKPTQHTRAGSSPATKTSTVSVSGFSKGHGRTVSAPIKHGVKRSTSLRRTKNSTEMLRQRSSKSKDLKLVDTASDAKRGRNFTVTNVGTGGTLYLRPSTHQGPMSPAMSPPPLTPLTAPATTLVMPDNDENLVLPTRNGSTAKNQALRTRSVSPKRLLGRIGKSKTEDPASRPPHYRSASFSTLDESRRSALDAWPKNLKIVINRADSTSAKALDLNLKPSLEISIPHYRLGEPRFSVHGTPMLRSSMVSRDSSVASLRRPSPRRQENSSTAPPPASLKALAKIRHLDTSIDEDGSKDHGTPNVANSQADQTPATERVGTTVTPAIYDDLNKHYDDPAVVRFAHDVRDMTAATPARIIAQISSESFMDYELVSDFFLTFRSYMTTLEVLDLLLARLAWAVGRMSDDGRIIRIRTFAALRHWILNYFVDDFVPNRRIRVRFCDEVNALYDEVVGKEIGGPSDLKILQDLKRCWKGRCALFWDGDGFSMDSDPNEDLEPGGIIGSRDPTYTHAQDFEPRIWVSQKTYGKSNKESAKPIASSKSSDKAKATPRHGQPLSQAKVALSSLNVQDASGSGVIPPVPAIEPKTRPDAEPQPASVLERRSRAPAGLRVTTSKSENKKQHKRNAASIDSIREPTPVGQDTFNVPWTEPFDGSLIRGFAYAPIEPFVVVPPHMPMSPSAPADEPPFSPPLRSAGGGPLTPSSPPAVKNIFGSIRRALSAKHGPNDVAVIQISNPKSEPSLLGKKSSMIISAPRSQNELRKQASGLTPRSPIRIDLLCAAAVESYQATVPGPSAHREQKVRDATVANQNLLAIISKADQASDRTLSQLTAQSGSILIVDGTHLSVPATSGALHPGQYADSSSSRHNDSTSDIHDPNPRTSFETQIAFQDSPETTPEQARNVLRPASVLLPEPAKPAVDRLSPQYQTLNSTVSAGTVRNRPSLTSSIANARPRTFADDGASVATPATDYQDTGEETARGVPPTLRRRPGGDLRKNHNVHDLEGEPPYHPSLDSLVDTTSSAPELIAITTNAPMPQMYRIQPSDPRKVSMIKTHSSQHLRPSFEAAVAGFSAIPDDDDGGLEATLAKLEGLYENKSPDLNDDNSPIGRSDSPALPEPPIKSPTQQSPARAQEAVSLQHDPSAASKEKSVLSPPPTAVNGSNLIPKQAVFGLPTESDVDSGSDRSLPLLKRESRIEGEESIPLSSYPVRTSVRPTTAHGPNSQTQEFVLGAAGNPFVGMGGLNILRPQTSDTQNSFLLEEDEDLSDLSSEMSVDIINYSEAMGSHSSPILVAPGTAVSGLEIPSHPLAHSSFVNLSVHPSLVLGGPPKTGDTPPPSEPSPQVGPQRDGETRDISHQVKSTSSTSGQPGARISVGPAHLPFVLACDSQILAQQLTVIEQSSLAEVEWSDLVEMRWSKQPYNAFDWAEFVTQKDDVKGVDLVVTRFNLMVKWAVSEIVLTQNIDERVRVIVKFIHVAAHARRLHNYATMLQLTIALTSTDCTRLAKTWQRVPEPDRSLLKNMETLIQPIRNFHDLRLEMESADLSGGCIPFIGLYVHDLTYNAQKPVEIPTGQGQEPLINFDRFRTAAVIIKGLLRLIDASSKYEFEPQQGIIERCLWIASLPEEKIRSLSMNLENSMS